MAKISKVKWKDGALQKVRAGVNLKPSQRAVLERFAAALKSAVQGEETAMTLTIELAPEQEALLRHAARSEGVPPERSGAPRDDLGTGTPCSTR